jgi:hypothetical protein
LVKKVLKAIVASIGRLSIVHVPESVDEVGHLVSVGAPQRALQQFLDITHDLEESGLCV